MNTQVTKSSQIKRDWHLIDLQGKILGRVASDIAVLLIGKKKIYFVPNLDTGDYVIAVNAEKVLLSGKKEEFKTYYRHSGYPGGFRKFTYEQMMNKNPKKIIELAVKGMLPKNKLRNSRMRRLKIFLDNNHPYQNKLKDKQEIKKNIKKNLNKGE